MGNAIHLLRLEHGNTVRLLDTMEAEARALDTGEPADRRLLSLAIEYLAGYPESCHHPKEELVIRHLLSRDPRAASGFERLVDDHASHGRRVAELAEALENGDGKSGRELAVMITRFCSEYRRHIDEEERTLFPRALATLGESDWAEIDFDLFDREDPLFDRGLEERFATLRESIEQRAGRDHRVREEREEEDWLAGVTGIEDFNERMRALRRDLTLVALGDGSHGVERAGALVLRIPPCSPAQAVWCAWYYWRGVDAELNGWSR